MAAGYPSWSNPMKRFELIIPLLRAPTDGAIVWTIGRKWFKENNLLNGSCCGVLEQYGGGAGIWPVAVVMGRRNAALESAEKFAEKLHALAKRIGKALPRACEATSYHYEIDDREHLGRGDML